MKGQENLHFTEHLLCASYYSSGSFNPQNPLEFLTVTSPYFIDKTVK